MRSVPAVTTINVHIEVEIFKNKTVYKELEKCNKLQIKSIISLQLYQQLQKDVPIIQDLFESLFSTQLLILL